MPKPLYRLFLVLFVAFLPVSGFAQPSGFIEIVKSKHFTVYGYPGLDVYEVLRSINFDGSLQGGSTSNGGLKSLLAANLDALFEEVSDTLDMHVYSLKGYLYIVPDQKAVSEMFRKYFGKSFSERSFYIYENNLICISLPDMTLGMLGHEMSHAIISHYFGVVPPARMQEILAGYVEYKLRKSAGTLP